MSPWQRLLRCTTRVPSGESRPVWTARALLGIAIDVGQHRQQRGRVIPRLASAAASAIADQLPEGESSGVDAEDAGTLPDKLLSARLPQPSLQFGAVQPRLHRLAAPPSPVS